MEVMVHLGQGGRRMQHDTRTQVCSWDADSIHPKVIPSAVTKLAVVAKGATL